MSQSSQWEGHFRWPGNVTWKSLGIVCATPLVLLRSQRTLICPTSLPSQLNKCSFNLSLSFMVIIFPTEIRSEASFPPAGVSRCSHAVCTPFYNKMQLMASTLTCSKMRIDNLEINHPLSHICFVIYHEPSLLFSTSFIPCLLHVLNSITLNFLWMIYFCWVLYRCEFDYV